MKEGRMKILVINGHPDKEEVTVRPFQAIVKLLTQITTSFVINLNGL